MQDSSHTKYLGLPSIIGRSNKVVFVEIKDKVCKKLAGWKGKLLSLGGKGSSYQGCGLSCSHLHDELLSTSKKSLYDDLEKMMRSFWWG